MIPLPITPKITQKGENKALFEIEGLYPGYAVTVGNALRRVLLSSLEGSAITQVKIKGVLHEFSTVPSVMEDVIIIMLNLKKLRFKMFSGEPQNITLSVKGEKEAKGKDFKLTSELELINPDEHIATLTKGTAELVIEAVVERGVGYEPIEKREIKKSEVGVMPLDAIYTPVKKVSLRVEDMRVGKRTDFGQISLEVETDGTITPQVAMNRAAEILVKHFLIVQDAFAEKIEEKVEKEGKTEKASSKKIDSAEKTAEELEENKKVKAEDLKVSERTKNALVKNSLKTVGGIIRKSEKDLGELEGMGDKAVGEIKKAIKKLGLFLKESE
ncbi:MAG: DNA-directed RNA polymerase subunit alpha [Candidatus Gribaldobacteria bacterium]|nr:DNA-directed RNA polymerase subunit alpha [Candidatus Gribaldobacteria bacterium]